MPKLRRPDLSEPVTLDVDDRCRREVLDALAEADAGDFVPWSEYQAAMRSLLRPGEADPFGS